MTIPVADMHSGGLERRHRQAVRKRSFSDVVRECRGRTAITAFGPPRSPSRHVGELNF